MRSLPGWDVAARTHVGRVRSHNEDAFVVDPSRGRLAVIDGMGGTTAGGVAADHVRRALLDAGELRAAFQAANRTILDHVARHPEHAGMGCVATAVELGPDLVSVAHVGDTRAYLVSEAGTEQLTRDHTRVAADQERYGLSDAQVRGRTDAHAITNDIGRRPRTDGSWVELRQAALSRGDVLVLCSDGLYDEIPPHRLLSLLGAARRARHRADRLADRLVAEALVHGASDNVTVVVARRRRAGEPLSTLLASAWSPERR